MKTTPDALTFVSIVIFVSGVVAILFSLMPARSTETADQSTEDAAVIGIDLAQGDRARVLYARQQAINAKEATYQVELSTQNR